MKRGTLVRAVFGGVVGLVVVLALLATVSATELGTRCLAGLIDWWADDRVSIGEVSGRLVETVRLHELEVRHQSLDLTAATVVLSWAPAKLLAGEVHVTALEMDGVGLELHDLPADSDEAPPTVLAFGLAAPSVTITDLTVVAGGEEIPVESVKLSAHLGAAEMTVTTLAAAGPNWHLTANGAVVPVAPFEVNLQAGWKIHVDGAEQHGRVTIAGDSQALDFDATMQAPFELRSNGWVKLTPQGHVISANGVWRDLRWPLFAPPSIQSPEGHFELGGTLDDLSVALDLELAGDGFPSTRLTLAGAGSVEPSATFPFEMAVRWHAMVRPDAVLSGELEASGDRENVVVRPRVLTPFAMSAEAALVLEGEPTFDAVAQWSGLFWPLAGAPVIASPEGRIEAKGSTAVVDVTLAAALEVPERAHDGRVSATARIAGRDTLEVAGSFDWEADLVDPGARFRGGGTLHGNPFDVVRFTHELSAPFTLSTAGEGRMGGPVPELHMAGEWLNLHWPPTRAARYRSATGTYTLNGALGALEIQLHGALDADGMPPAQAALMGRLDDAGLDLEPLLMHGLGGQVTVRGRIGWRPTIHWKLALDARGLDPGRKWSQWGGALDGVAVVQGEMVDGVARTAVDVQRLEGQLRGYPVEGHGEVEISGDRLHAHKVSLRSGDNRLELDGVYDQVMNLEFSLDAANLSAVFPGAEGRLAGAGVVGGSVASPGVNVRLTGQNVRYRNWGIGWLEVDAEISETQAASRMAAKIVDARAGDYPIESAELRADGSLAAHTAHAVVTSSLGRVDLRLAGGMEAERWRGELTDTTLIPSGGDTWRLARAAPVRVDADRIRIEGMCLESDAGAGACAEFERTDHIRSSIDIEALPLSVLGSWLPEHSTLTGKLDAVGVWSLTGDRLEGNLVASVSPGELSVLRGKAERLSVGHADTRLKITVDEGGAEVGFASMLDGDGRVHSTVVVQGLHGDAALDGTIEVSLPRLAPILPLVAGPFAAEGRASMEARLGGSVAAPRATGVARVEVDRARIHDLGIELSDARLGARADGEQRIAIDGVLHSGQGHLSIDGSALLETERRTPIELVVTGESFEILRLPDAVVAISPDVKVDTVGQSLEVSGRVVIPRARITPPESTEGTVGVSGDEVLVDRDGNVAQAGNAVQTEAGSGPDIVADLVVSLGDDVIFDGFGLTSRLAGELRVRQTPGGVPTAHGAVDLLDGQYMIYGQRLDIEHGRVTFAGPLTDPGLDIRAVREAGEVTAGIVIGGTVSNPISRVHSEPPLSEAEAFSVLLTGQALSEANQREAALLSQAALSLGLEGSERIGLRIQSVLGLDELSIGGVGDAGEASLILGKRLNSDLGVRYVRWLVRRSGSVFVNYRLTDHFSLEAESGVRQGLDLLFSIERDEALQ